MFESWVSRRKNPYLRDALLLRKAGKYEAANLAFERAAQEDTDGEALYFKEYNAYIRSECLYDFKFEEVPKRGCLWPIPQFQNITRKNYEILFQDTGNILAYFFGSEGWHEYNEDVKCSTLYSAESGDPYAQFLMRYTNIKFLKGSFLQESFSAIKHVIHCDNIGCFCMKLDAMMVAKVLINNCCDFGILHRLNICVPTEIHVRLQELYIYGRYFDLYTTISHPTVKIAISYYKTSWERANKCVVAWLHFGRLFLIKDLVRLIGKMVWESRVRPDEWGVTI